METKYENIIAIREDDGQYADKYLQAGWKLIETIGVSKPTYELYYILYSFGWPKEKGEIKEVVPKFKSLPNK